MGETRVDLPWYSMSFAQVAPTELEDLIRRHPGVNDVAVVGVPDERAGELELEQTRFLRRDMSFFLRQVNFPEPTWFERTAW
jgi:hypothetical protein